MQRIPDSPRFAEVAYRHSGPACYVARNRVTAHVVAVSDVELLDH
ncbi:hypothetical protein [Nocardiopsis ansamitocini]|nr:hypothetical protein [Nocardiopsis ansamitocini]